EVCSSDLGRRGGGRAMGGIGGGHGLESKAGIGKAKAGTGNGEQGMEGFPRPANKNGPVSGAVSRGRKPPFPVPRSLFPAFLSRRPWTGRRRRPPRRRPTPAPRAPCARARPCR